MSTLPTATVISGPPRFRGPEGTMGPTTPSEWVDFYRYLQGLSNGGNHDKFDSILADDRKLPFLAIETDGRPFPQLIEARIEAFTLQAQRLNDEMLMATAEIYKRASL